jgi:hypothetical protein
MGKVELMEIIPSNPKPVPMLPALVVYKRPLLRRVLMTLGYSVGGSAVVSIGLWFISPAAMVPLIWFATIFTFVILTIFGWACDLGTQGPTIEELQYRRRLSEALSCDSRVAQLKADYERLKEAGDSLYTELGAEEFKKLKNQDFIERAILLARKKTVD